MLSEIHLKQTIELLNRQVPIFGAQEARALTELISAIERELSRMRRRSGDTAGRADPEE